MFESVAPSTESSRSMLEARSVELFSLCDLEGKGFINKKDMQRVCNAELGMSPDVLEEVFETLDADQNGFLTLDEFTYGFANLFQTNDGVDTNSSYSVDMNSHMSLENDEEENENAFNETMESLDAAALIQNRLFINSYF